MSEEAVALTYLEWVRLIANGGIRLDQARVVRYRRGFTDPAEVVCDLMRGAPDVGVSATDFVLAVLEPEVLDRVREAGLDLGRRLTLEAVRSFHSFGEEALTIHRHDAESAGVRIGPTPLEIGWMAWASAVAAAGGRAQGAALLSLLDVPASKRFEQAGEMLGELERHIDHETIARMRDTMFFGWACILNAQKVRTGASPLLPHDVREEIDSLRRDYNVEQPFLQRASRLVELIRDPAVGGERQPT